MRSLELVVRREHEMLPTYHITVAATGPILVLESFDLQSGEGLAAVTETAMERLRTRGYRLLAAVELHGSYATGRLAAAEREAASRDLAVNVAADFRAMAAELPNIDSRQGAAIVSRHAAALIAGAYAIKARADSVLVSDEQVEAAAILDDAMTTVTEAEATR